LNSGPCTHQAGALPLEPTPALWLLSFKCSVYGTHLFCCVSHHLAHFHCQVLYYWRVNTICLFIHILWPVAPIFRNLSCTNLDSRAQRQRHRTDTVTKIRKYYTGSQLQGSQAVSLWNPSQPITGCSGSCLSAEVMQEWGIVVPGQSRQKNFQDPHLNGKRADMVVPTCQPSDDRKV
jgi:hypothetical protein